MKYYPGDYVRLTLGGTKRPLTKASLDRNASHENTVTEKNVSRNFHPSVRSEILEKKYVFHIYV